MIAGTFEFSEKAEDLYNALPKRVKLADYRANGNKPLNPAQKALSLYKNARSINVSKAIKNLIADEAGDRVIGAFSQRANRITQHPYWRRPAGPQAGNRYWTRSPHATLIGE